MLTAEMVKTFQFLGAIALFGGPAFALLIWAPSVRALRGSAPEPEAERSPLQYLRLMVLLGAGAMLLFGPLDLVRFARVAADQPLATAGWQMLIDVAVGTRYGRMVLLRSALSLVALGIAAGLQPWQGARPGRPGGLWPIREVLLLTLGAGGLLSFTLTSHAAATEGRGLWPLLADAAHLFAVGAWVGGLALLGLAPFSALMASAEGRRLLRGATGRFATLGLAAVVTLALTGIYLSSLRVYGPPALVETDYGLALLVKLLLFVALVTVALINRFGLLPGLAGDPVKAGRAAGWMQSLIRAEVLLTVIALSFAADLTILSPPDLPPVRVNLVVSSGQVQPAELRLPLGRTVRMQAANQTGIQFSLQIAGFEHRLTRGPGAVRHREMLSYAPPTDRLWLYVPPGRTGLVEFTPLAEGEFWLESAEGRVRLLVETAAP